MTWNNNNNYISDSLKKMRLSFQCALMLTSKQQTISHFKLLIFLEERKKQKQP